MKKNILFFHFVLIVSIMFLCGLNCTKSIKDDSIYSSDRAVDVSYWLDPETDTVHKMITINEESSVVSIIKYSNGITTEVMDIVKSEIIDGRLNWAYYVPSTGYTVMMKIVSSNDNEITVAWDNRDVNDETDSGEEVLIRCEENGAELSPHDINVLNDTVE
ncbi:MAG: hypothetical protein FWH53_05345 [Leptospirales bacterium]|nr:hypothetical protein [Leptospirales bacterium]